MTEENPTAANLKETKNINGKHVFPIVKSGKHKAH